MLNMSIDLSQEEIDNLTSLIKERVAKLSNIDDILKETKENLTIANALKDRADQAR